MVPLDRMSVHCKTHTLTFTMVNTEKPIHLHIAIFLFKLSKITENMLLLVCVISKEKYENMMILNWLRELKKFSLICEMCSLQGGCLCVMEQRCANIKRVFRFVFKFSQSLGKNYTTVLA